MSSLITHSWFYLIAAEILIDLFVCAYFFSSESTEPDRSKNRKNGEKQSTTMSGSAMA